MTCVPFNSPHGQVNTLEAFILGDGSTATVELKRTYDKIVDVGQTKLSGGWKSVTVCSRTDDGKWRGQGRLTWNLPGVNANMDKHFEE